MDYAVVGAADVGYCYKRQTSAGFQAQPLRVFEMNSATIKSVSQVSHIGLGLPRDEDCRVPAGATVMEYKTCENCGRPFTRPRVALQAVVLQNPDDYFSNHLDDTPTKTIYKDVGIKFCNECHQRYLMPVDEEVYRETLPKITHHPQRLIHYDDSLSPKKVVGRLVLAFPREHKLQGKLGNWVERLQAALKTHGMMTRKEMIKITGHIDEHSLKSTVTQRKLKLERVASMWPRVGRGTATGYYKLVKP